MIQVELMQWEPVIVVRATVEDYQAHGSGATVEAAEDLAVARALAWQSKILLGVVSHEPVEVAVAAPPEPEPKPTPTPRVLNTGNSNFGGDSVADGKRFTELASATTVEMKRVGWGHDEGRNYLKKTYGKNKRGDLSLPEYEEFYAYLLSLPTYLPGANK